MLTNTENTKKVINNLGSKLRCIIANIRLIKIIDDTTLTIPAFVLSGIKKFSNRNL
jgi:hypothetical protein